MNFTLKWINVFFIPSFIILPLSDPISFIECLKIAAVFVVGFLALFFLDVYIIWGFKQVLALFNLLPETENAATSSDEEFAEDIELEPKAIALDHLNLRQTTTFSLRPQFRPSL